MHPCSHYLAPEQLRGLDLSVADPQVEESHIGFAQDETNQFPFEINSA